jgi:hypothetical protein
MEWKNRGRSSIISKCIEFYPRALAVTDHEMSLPLNKLLRYDASSVDDALMMIEKLPAALQHWNNCDHLPLHIECNRRCRSIIISKCIEIHPNLLDDATILLIVDKVDKLNFLSFSAQLSTIFTIRPMSLYHRHPSIYYDIRKDPCYRRRILHMLPYHVFFTHNTDYRDLNWQPREAMLILFSQTRMKTQKS